MGREGHSTVIHNATTKPFEDTTYYRRYSNETNLVCNVKSIVIWRQSYIGFLGSVGATDVSGWRATAEQGKCHVPD